MNDSAGRHGSTARRSWDLGDDPAQILAGARRALFVMVGVLALLWVIQIANWADHYNLTLHYGIRGRDVASLPDIITAPFLHFSWAHIEGNSGPLFIFGFLAAYRGVARFAWVSAVVVLVSGLAAWFSEGSHTVGAGASGVVFGYFGYIMVRGFFDRHPIDMLVGAVMALCFAYQFTVLLPHAGIGWQAHIGGLVGGVAAGWIFRDRKARAVAGTAGTASTSGGKPGKAVSPATGTFGGDRADLHKQLDDLGL
ncbi:MAG TPA: rhomboid family intramembrane serine protease [Streptosporangiaceae bacterium]|nr:rhomboid family intramembrane serine protease [Streptosporangiaceae bacterium]